MSARKIQWSKPQLIVLGHGKPEENVLAFCKAGSSTGPSGSGCATLGVICSNLNKS